MTIAAELHAWLNGVPDGGPHEDGRYPLTYADGLTYLVYCPAAQALNPALEEQPIEVFANTATAAASTATTAASEATSARLDAVTAAANAQSYASTANTHRANAQTAANTANTRANTATSAATTATNARDKAQEWADNDEDVAVETGKFSAKHWAQKALAAAGAIAAPVWANITGIPANITAWAGIAPSAKANDNAVVKTSGNQSGLSGSKEWTGAHTFKSRSYYYFGNVGAQSVVDEYGWNDEVGRWKHVLQPSGALAIYSYNDTGGGSANTLQISSPSAGGVANLSFLGNDVYHAGNLTIPSSSDYVATSGNQTGLSGNKTWTGVHNWASTSASPNITTERTNNTVNSLYGATTTAGTIFFGHGVANSFTIGDSVNQHTSSNNWFRVNSSDAYVHNNLVYHAGNLVPSDYALEARTISAGNGLSGGGTLAANRTITLGTPGNITLASTNGVTTSSHTHSFAPGGTTAQYIRGDGSLASFPSIPAGTVTSVSGGNGLSGSVTSSGSITLGTPGTITSSTTNAVQTSSHTHALTLVAADIPNLAASQVTSGSFAAARIPNLNASKITAGTLPLARGGTGGTTTATARTGIGIFVQSGDPGTAAATGDLWIW